MKALAVGFDDSQTRQHFADALTAEQRQNHKIRQNQKIVISQPVLLISLLSNFAASSPINLADYQA